jgi:bifunctional NMN adenylyltransferase/nudix hydrolase
MSAQRAPLAVVVGCFPLYHRGHHALVSTALAEADQVVVVLGSAFHARTPRDPFTAEEREAMIRLCVPEPDRERVSFVPVRDYYDDARWVAAVTAAVASRTPEARTIRVVLRAKDDPERYTEWFPRWQQVVVEEHLPVDARKLRCILLEAGIEPGASPARIDGALAVLAEWVPKPVVGYLRAWSRLPFYRELAADQAAIQEWEARWASAPHTPVFTTVDAVVLDGGNVLLVKRKGRPGAGLWALPGGFVDAGESLIVAAMRELREETDLGLHSTLLRQALERVVVFDDPHRSQRGRIVTHAHFFRFDHRRLPPVKGGDDDAAASWVPLAELSALEDRFFEDHFHILDEFLRLT